MLSDRARGWIADILQSIERIHGWIGRAGGIDAAVYGDELYCSGIERQLLIVSEAAIRIDRREPGELERLEPSLPWNDIRGIGNIIRHRYNEIGKQHIVVVLDRDLNPLEAACRRLLAGP